MFRQLLILVAIVAVASANRVLYEEQQKIHKQGDKEQQKFYKECVEELDYDPDDDDPIKQNKYNCFSRCVNKKSGIINENGELVLEKIIEHKSFDRTETEKAVETCKDITRDDECETAAKRVGCVYWEVSDFKKRLEKEMEIQNKCRDKMELKEGEENRKNGMCFSKCVAQKNGMINEDGTLNSKNILGEKFSAENEKIDEAVQTCEKTAEDDCDQVMEKVLCLMKWKHAQKYKSNAS